MSLEKIGHYSLTNPSSVYDEEALTALELAGRTAGKVNEAVGAFNKLETETNGHLLDQDKEIADRLKAQDDAIPVKVTQEVQEQIDNGTFDKQISDYAGDLEGRLDNLLGSVTTGTTTMDAEVIDIRLGADGKTYENAGLAVRTPVEKLIKGMTSQQSFAYVDDNTELIITTNVSKTTIYLTNSITIVNSVDKTKRQFTPTEFLDAVEVFSDSVELVIDRTNNSITSDRMSIQYNFDTDSIVVNPDIANSKQDVNNLILFECYYRSYIGGSLYEHYVNDVARRNRYIVDLQSEGYMGDGAPVTILPSISPNTGGLQFYSLEHKILLKTSPSASILVSDIFDVAETTTFVTVDREALTLRGHSFALVFNKETNSIEFTKSFGFSKDKHLVLYNNHYYSTTFGMLVDYVNRKNLMTLLPDLEAVKRMVETGNKYPEYYDEHLETVVKTVRDNMANVGKNGETFVFITDLHWEMNKRHSPALMEHILNHTNINHVLCGGDFINQGEREYMIETLTDCINSFKFPDKTFHTLFGNHDNNWNDYGDHRTYPERKFTYNNVYSFMYKQQENEVTYLTDNEFSYYFDNPTTKTRFLCIDTGENGGFTPYSELADVLKNTPDGYHIIILAHWLYQSSTKSTFCNNLETIVDALNSKTSVTVNNVLFDFTSINAEVVYIQGAHLHNDLDWKTAGGVPVIFTDTDSTRYGDVAGTTGTITEQCFDVVTIDYVNKTINMVRVGRGNNRTFTY